ncbi:hypothetical protein [Desulfonatronum thioautotrophicum]|uniref:hypothetical protein n=1 Tax=Desulfonatronum thioautotrophicum TaxID=617001 RepID=UPI00069C347A|nr:hypothetical protein [Desulfonatronum thioautotrophicum]
MSYTADFPEPYDKALGNLPLMLMRHDAPELFSLLLQGGFLMPVPEPCTLREFLCELVGVCGVYTEKTIQTIFLDGLAIDDLDTALIRPGSRLALSAAMPGLAGATMRRGGYYRKMREGISQRSLESAQDQAKDPFRLQVRLYNMVGRDLAGLFLHQGILTPSSDFRQFLMSQPQKFFDHLHAVELDGVSLPSTQESVGSWPLPDEDLGLRVAD